MKILQIAPYFPPFIGGQERYILNLSKYLSKRGHSVLVATSNYPKTKRYERISDKVNVLRFNYLIRILRNPITPTMFFTLRDLLTQFDIIHAHNEHAFTSLVSSSLKKDKSKPFLITCHGRLIFENSILNGIERLYSKTLGKFIFDLADHIVVLSKYDSNYISSLGVSKRKISIIPNAIDAKYLSSLSTKVNLITVRKKYSIPSNTKIILFVGALIRRKGIHFLIKSIPFIVRNLKNEKVLFLVVGKGPLYEQLLLFVKKHGVKKYVRFLKNIPFEDLIGLYQISDLLIIPSLSEGLPTVLLEALYFQLPVISTKLPGITEYFGKVIPLIPPSDAMAIAKSILNHIHNEDTLEKIAKKGKRLIEEKFLWNKIIDKYESIYVSLIS